MTQVTMTADELRRIARAKPKLKRGERSAKIRARYAATTPAAQQTEAEITRQRSLFERHDAIEVRIRLPLPPSANGLKAIRQLPDRRPFLVPSTEYNIFKAAVAVAWRDHWNGYPPEPITGRLRVRGIVHMARRGGDVANREKALCDALTECGAWGDDEQIDDIHFIRGEIIKGTGALDLVIEVIPE